MKTGWFSSTSNPWYLLPVLSLMVPFVLRVWWNIDLINWTATNNASARTAVVDLAFGKREHHGGFWLRRADGVAPAVLQALTGSAFLSHDMTGDANRSTPTAMSPAYEFFLCCVSLIIGAIFASPSQHLIFVSSRSLFRVFLPFFFFSHISSLAYFPFINYTMCRSKMEES
jgi:hypothetical protein